MSVLVINFIDTGLDDYILKSMLGNSRVNQVELLKSVNRSGLVQKEITVTGKNGKTFTRKQWVRASEDKKNESSTHWTKVDSSEDAKKQIAQMIADGKTKQQIMSEFKLKGVTWKEHEHAGINWMRASMAINKYITSQSVSPSNKSNSHLDSLNKQLDSLKKELQSVESQINKLRPEAHEVYKKAYEDRYNELNSDSLTAPMTHDWKDNKAASHATRVEDDYKGYGELKKRKTSLNAQINKLEEKIEDVKITQGKTQIDRNLQIYKSLNTDVVDLISQSVGTSDTAAKDVWLKYEHKLKSVDYNGNKTAHYVPGIGVYMNIQKDIDKVDKAEKWDEEHPDKVSKFGKSSDKVESRLDTFFHEFFHNIDYVVPSELRNGSRWFSIGYKNGLFADTIREEINSLVNERWNNRKKVAKECTKSFSLDNINKLLDEGLISDIQHSDFKDMIDHLKDDDDQFWMFFPGSGNTPESREKFMVNWLQDKKRDSFRIWRYTKKSFIYDEIGKELRKIPSRDRSGISDVFEGATKGKLRSGYGHGKSYWEQKSYDMLSLEAFANMGSAYMEKANNNQMDTFKKYLPKSTAIFEDMLKELTKEV